MALEQSLWYEERVLGWGRGKQEGPKKGGAVVGEEGVVTVGMSSERGFARVRVRSARATTAVHGSWMWTIILR